jgi:hypothetical protein
MKMTSARSEIDASNAAGLKPGRGEWFALLLVLTVFWIVNLVTCTRSPLVWIDEVAYSDPAVNLYMGNGFQSTAWKPQQGGDFWAGNVPFYPFLLFLWLKLFGLSILSVRTLNYLLASAAVIFLWRFSWKSGDIRKPWTRLLLVLLIFGSYGVTYAYRSGRPDMLGFLLVSLLPNFYLSSKPRWKILGFFGIGFLLPFAGLQLLPYSAMLGVLLTIRFGRDMGRLVLAAWVGSFVGGLSLLGLYAANGALGDFLASIGHHTTAGQNVLGKLLNLPQIFYHPIYSDPALDLLILSIAGLLIARWGKKSHDASTVFLRWGLTFGILIPVGIYCAGDFMLYYSWMAFVPAAFCLCGYFALQVTLRKSDLLAMCVVSIIMLSGLPLRTVTACLQWNERSYCAVERLVEQSVGPADVAVADYAAYYAVKTRASRVFLHHYALLMTKDEEKNSVSVIVESPEHITEIIEKLGGEWNDTGLRLSVADPWISLPAFLRTRIASPYSLVVYKRSQPLSR